MAWSYDRNVRRYRSGNGRFLAKSKVVAIRDAVVDAAAKEARDLAAKAVRGEITADAFRAGMRVAIRNAHVAEYSFGRGGINAMTSADFGRIGNTLRNQYAYLENFVTAIESSTLSEAKAAARAAQYMGAGVTSFEQGQAAAWGVNLPTYPGQLCLGGGSCRCRWDIKETETEIQAQWVTESKPCDVCAGLGNRYNPFSIPKYRAQPDTTPVRLSAIKHGLRLVG